jgi:hypothetical protein
MGFASLQHIRIRRSTDRGLCLPATFRPQGLVTLSTVCSLRIRAGFVSHRPRSWDLPFGAFSSRKVSGPFPAGSTHLPLVRRYTQSRQAGRGRRGVPRFLGFDPSRSPLQTSLCLARRLPDAPLGFCSRGPAAAVLPGFRPNSSHALLRPALPPTRGAPESRSTAVFARPSAARRPR